MTWHPIVPLNRAAVVPTAAAAAPRVGSSAPAGGPLHRLGPRSGIPLTRASLTGRSDYKLGLAALTGSSGDEMGCLRVIAAYLLRLSAAGACTSYEMWC